VTASSSKAARPPQTKQASILGSSAPEVTTDTGSALEKHLAASLRAVGAPAFVREHRFHPTRKFRIDFAWPERMLAVELEGGIYRGGAHTSVAGIKRDVEKSNLLTMSGWRLLRFHGDQVKSGEAVALILQALEPDR
jgi:very-short-patch-repair endonuclease